VIFPAISSPIASPIFIMLTSLPLKFPAIIGPPDMIMLGIFSRAAAISIPGTILSQLATKTKASKQWAKATDSMESAINSRVGNEYFMPGLPQIMPSHTPIAGKIRGLPPAVQTPAATASVILFKCICPGMIVLKELHIPIQGFLISSLVIPSAFIKDLALVRVMPSFKISLLICLFLLLYCSQDGWLKLCCQNLKLIML
jgi:hypothetical protein